jgi:predicted transposase YbfD/YdcC
MDAPLPTIHMRPVFVVMAMGCFVLFLGGPLVVAVIVLIFAPLDVSMYLAPGAFGFFALMAWTISSSVQWIELDKGVIRARRLLTRKIVVHRVSDIVAVRTLDLSGAIVTIDAAGCQTENARLIRSQGGHYLLAVKDNQPTLRAAVERVVEAACEADLVGMEGSEEVDDAHGRHEERYVGVFKEPEGIPTEWPDVAAVVQVNREREVGGVRTCTSHYYLTSYAGTAAELGRWVRDHWGIENGLHWVLDVVFREDRSRIREENAGANLAMIRRVAVSLLRRAPGKGSGVTKRLKAGWDEDYMLQVLQGITAPVVR